MVAYERLPYPTRLTVDIHSHCNARCVMCPYPELAPKLPKGKMDKGLYHKIITDFGDIADRNGFRGRLGFCVMGEPFVATDIVDYVKPALERRMRINFTTNAALMKPESIDQVLAAGFDGTFNISVHGIQPETVERIMGLNLEDMLRNIDYLIERYPKEKIHVTAIHIDWPKGERKEVLAYWKERGIEVHSPLPGSRAGLMEGLEEQAIEKLAGCKSRRPLYHMTCNINGDVTLCCNDMAQQVIVGNLRENTMEEVWNSKKFLAYVDMVYGEKPAPEDFICRRCEWGMANRGPLERLKKEWRRTVRKAHNWLEENRRG